jgi:hypothetical protein
MYFVHTIIKVVPSLCVFRAPLQPYIRTTDQSLHDQPLKDLHEHRRESVLFQLPGQLSINENFPTLDGKIGGCGIRGRSDGSLTDITFNVVRYNRTKSMKPLNTLQNII